MEQKEGIQALMDGRRFKDKKGNVYLWSDDHLFKSPFRVNVKDEADMIPGLHNFWDVLDELVEIFEIIELEVDTRVLVTDGMGASLKPRYFKGWDEQGNILCYSNGCTSFSSFSNDHTNKWLFWEVARGKHKGKTNFPQT